MIGRVKFFSHEKQFGFITTEGGDFFFHGNNVIGEVPVAPDIVEFWLTDDPRRTVLWRRRYSSDTEPSWTARMVKKLQTLEAAGFAILSSSHESVLPSGRLG